MAQTKAAEHQLDVFVKPNDTMRLVFAGIASYLLQTSTALDHAYDDSYVPPISFSAKARNYETEHMCFPTCHLFTGNLTSVA